MEAVVGEYIPHRSLRKVYSRYSLVAKESIISIPENRLCGSSMFDEKCSLSLNEEFNFILELLRINKLKKASILILPQQTIGEYISSYLSDALFEFDVVECSHGLESCDCEENIRNITMSEANIVIVDNSIKHLPAERLINIRNDLNSYVLSPLFVVPGCFDAQMFWCLNFLHEQNIIHFYGVKAIGTGVGLFSRY